ncbi:MAG: 3-hydroxybutyrate oligomer hydrolase family protein [Burkholderiaceae bacterium]
MRQGAGALSVSLLALCWSGASVAGPNCDDIKQFLQDKAVGVTCTHFDDLRTQGGVTPANNSITTFADGTPLPGVANGFLSYTPTTDRGVISNGPAPSSNAVPGIQVTGWFADDPTKQARFLLRFPDDWNGKLVVAGASGTRSEHNGDWAWSDYVLPRGYAYASQNKGVLNLYLPLTGAADPLACRLNPASTTWVHFYDNDPDKPFTQWTYYMLHTASLAKKAVKAAYGQPARRTYAVGTSNGGYQVRRAIEEGPDLFDGGVDWEGTSIHPNRANLLTELPVVLKNFPGYVASGYNASSPEAQAILAAGYPKDIVVRNPTTNAVTDSLWSRYNTQFWEVTMCQWQKRFDPTYPTYATGLENYDYATRKLVPGVYAELAAVQTTGKIKKPLVTVAGTMDALLPVKNHARGYEDVVNASRKGNNDKRNAQYRLYEVQNGNHIEGYALLFPQLKLIQPHAQKAFDLMVQHVEDNAPLPPSQCIPTNGSISATPSQPGHCVKLLD